tara:strand:+ start:644 stop:2056 length:1413 start_codon:yes stop_codon:yes gene_type:complete
MGINRSGGGGRRAIINVPGPSSKVGARGAGAQDGLAAFQNYIKQSNIDRNNKELLEKAGFKTEHLDNMSSENLELRARDLSKNKVVRDEAAVTRVNEGTILQKFLENKSQVEQRDERRLDTPLDLMFGERTEINDPLSAEAKARADGAIEGGRDTVNIGRAGDSINDPLSGMETLTRALQKSSFDTAGGIQTNPFFKTLMETAKAGDTDTSVKNQVINMQDEDGSGIIGMINKQTGQTRRAFEDTLKGRKTVKIPLTVRKNINVDNQKSARNALTTKMAKDVANDLGLKLRYTKLFQRYDPNQFLTVNRLRLKLQKAFDGAFNFIGLPKDEKFNSTEDQIAFSNAVSFINEAKEIFIEHRILATGGAFTEQEMEQLKTVYLDVDGQGPEAFIATVRGKMNRLSESINANEQFFSKLDNDVSISELIRYQSDYIDNLLLTGDIFNAGLPIVNKRKENLKKLDTYKIPGEEN